MLNGWRWSLESTGFFLAFAVLTLGYHLTVVIRERRPERAYLTASLAVVIAGLVVGGEGVPENAAGWREVVVASGFALWAVDLYDRAGRVARELGR